MRDFEKELNKLVLKVDGGKNEWTFKGEVWQTIRDWARQRDNEWEKNIEEILENLEAPDVGNYDMEAFHEGFFSAIDLVKKGVSNKKRTGK